MTLLFQCLHSRLQFLHQSSQWPGSEEGSRRHTEYPPGGRLSGLRQHWGPAELRWVYLVLVLPLPLSCINLPFLELGESGRGGEWFHGSTALLPTHVWLIAEGGYPPVPSDTEEPAPLQEVHHSRDLGVQGGLHVLQALPAHAVPHLSICQRISTQEAVSPMR